MRTISLRGARALLAAAVVAAAVMPAPVSAEVGEIFKTGDQLYPLCASQEATDVAACEWYLMGVFDATTLYADVEYSDRLICVTRSVTAEEIREIVVGYMEASESIEYSAVSLVFNALQEAFPCSGQSV